MADYASGRGYGVLLNSLFRGVMSGKDERFLVATESGIVRVFAPESVRREVEEKLQPGSSWCRQAASGRRRDLSRSMGQEVPARCQVRRDPSAGRC